MQKNEQKNKGFVKLLVLLVLVAATVAAFDSKIGTAAGTPAPALAASAAKGKRANAEKNAAANRAIIGRKSDGFLRRGRMVLERARRRELAELVSHHVFRDVDRKELLPVVDVEIKPDEVRRNRRTARPGLDGLAVAAFLRGQHFVHQGRFHVVAFFD